MYLMSLSAIENTGLYIFIYTQANINNAVTYQLTAEDVASHTYVIASLYRGLATALYVCCFGSICCHSVLMFYYHTTITYVVAVHTLKWI